MSEKQRIDCECAKDICKRLGVKRETRRENNGLRDEVLAHLGKNIERLAALANRGSISLYDLSTCRLVPRKLANLIYFNAPVNRAKLDMRLQFL